MEKQNIEMCIKRYGKDVYSFCCYLTHSKQEADDLYQDTFLKMMEKKDELHMEENPKGYLLSVAVGLWKNRSRKIARHQKIAPTHFWCEETEGEIPDEALLPEEDIIQREQQMEIRRAVHNLPDKLRVLVLLYYMEDRDIGEIAEMMHLPKGTIKSRLFKARELLKQELEEMS